MPEPGGLPARGTVLAFDFGEKRIGVAVGECELRSASPLLTFDAETNDARWSAVGRLLDEWKPVTLVVGLPLSPDGVPHDMTARAERFARQLEGRCLVRYQTAIKGVAPGVVRLEIGRPEAATAFARNIL